MDNYDRAMLKAMRYRQEKAKSEKEGTLLEKASDPEWPRFVAEGYAFLIYQLVESTVVAMDTYLDDMEKAYTEQNLEKLKSLISIAYHGNNISREILKLFQEPERAFGFFESLLEELQLMHESDSD